MPMEVPMDARCVKLRERCEDPTHRPAWDKADAEDPPLEGSETPARAWHRREDDLQRRLRDFLLNLSVGKLLPPFDFRQFQTPCASLVICAWTYSRKAMWTFRIMSRFFAIQRSAALALEALAAPLPIMGGLLKMLRT